ncbi:hypothetical protein CYMTET_44222, partial [Cymbomonas tetramitiformis]
EQTNVVESNVDRTLDQADMLVLLHSEENQMIAAETLEYIEELEKEVATKFATLEGKLHELQGELGEERQKSRRAREAAAAAEAAVERHHFENLRLEMELERERMRATHAEEAVQHLQGLLLNEASGSKEEALADIAKQARERMVAAQEQAARSEDKYRVLQRNLAGTNHEQLVAQLHHTQSALKEQRERAEQAERREDDAVTLLHTVEAQTVEHTPQTPETPRAMSPSSGEGAWLQERTVVRLRQQLQEERSRTSEQMQSALETSYQTASQLEAAEARVLELTEALESEREVAAESKQQLDNMQTMLGEARGSYPERVSHLAERAPAKELHEDEEPGILGTEQRLEEHDVAINVQPDAPAVSTSVVTDLDMVLKAMDEEFREEKLQCERTQRALVEQQNEVTTWQSAHAQAEAEAQQVHAELQRQLAAHGVLVDHELAAAETSAALIQELHQEREDSARALSLMMTELKTAKEEEEATSKEYSAAVEEERESRVRAERASCRMETTLTEAQEAIHGWETAEASLDNMSDEVHLLQRRLAAAEVTANAAEVRAASYKIERGLSGEPDWDPEKGRAQERALQAKLARAEASLEAHSRSSQHQLGTLSQEAAAACMQLKESQQYIQGLELELDTVCNWVERMQAQGKMLPTADEAGIIQERSYGS